MKIGIEKVANGSMDGQEVFICDLRREDLNKKPQRSVPPTKVRVVSAKEIAKSIYYSESYFAKLSKSGGLTKTVIQPYDNTGFRYRTGTPVNVFDNYDECQHHYREQVDAVIEALNVKKNNYERIIDEEINELKKMKAEQV